VTSAKNMATGCCACAARAPRSSWSRCRPQWEELSNGLLESARAGRPAQQPRHPDGPSRSYPPPAAPRGSSRHTDDQGTPSHAAPQMSRPCSTLVLTCGTSRSPPATPTRAPRCGTTGPATTSTATRTTSWPPTWLPVPDEARVSRCSYPGKRPTLPRRVRVAVPPL
jgi:hypothetical protein